MRVFRQTALTLAISALGCIWASSAFADDAELFDPSRMHVIKLTLPQKSWDGLEADRNKYQPGTLSLAATDGTPGGVDSFSAPVSIMVKLKGSASYRPLTDKSAFKIKFEDAPFRGLRTMTLNNMVEDPSMIHETLAYTAFRGVGVPASRTGYAYVYVNGKDFGVHLNIEALDEIALARIFGSFDSDVQHLYEGENGADVHPSLKAKFEVDEGDDEDLGDLEALVSAVNSSGSQPWAERVAAVANLEEMTRMWATEKYIGQWDGYAGQQDASWLPNNYYLYSDPNGRFQILPWGNDESWQAPYHLPFDGRAGLMFDSCLDDEVCFGIYRKSLAAVHKAIAGMGLDALAVSTAALLAPWQEKEEKESTREEWGLEEIEDEVTETREFIASRPEEASTWLGLANPPWSGADPIGSPSTSLQAPASSGPLTPSLRVGKTWVVGGILRAQVQLRASGVVTLRATVSTGKGALVVCRNRARVEQARRLILRCRLPATLSERLQQGPLSMTVATRFLPVGGSPENVARWITLPRS